MAKKNVLLVINQLHSGGAEKVVAGLSHDLSSFYNVHIVIFNDLEKIGYPYAGNLIRIALPYAKTAEKNSIPARALRFLVLIRKLRKIKKQHNIDVAISFLEASNFINILSKQKEKVHVSVRSFITVEINKNKQISIYRPLIKKLYKRANNVVVPSQLAAEDLVTNFGIDRKQICEIPNYLDFERITRLKQEPLQLAQHEAIFRHPVLINVGRLHQAKGQFFLLPVFKKVKEANPAVKLVILGDGHLKDDLIQRCKQLQLKVCTPEQLLTVQEQDIPAYDVFLLGNQENPYQFLQKARVFLFPSLYEGFPNALIEAMSIGLPVVAADCDSGPREILAPGTDLKQKARQAEEAAFGILMPPVTAEAAEVPADAAYKGADQWAAAITGLLTDQQKLADYSARAKKRTLDYSKEIIIDKWKALISQ